MTLLRFRSMTTDMRLGSGNAFHDAVRSIVERTISWIERDRQRKTAGGVIIPITQEMIKQSPQTPTYTSLPGAPGNTSSSHNGTEQSNSSGTPTTAMPTSRSSYFGETTTDQSSYPPIPYGDSSGHGPNNMQYDGNHQFMYAQGPDQVTAAHVQAQSQAQVQGQAQQNTQPPSQAQTPVTDHNPLTAFATQATQIAQPDMLWRQQAAAATGGNTWQDWTAAIVDNQDRYSANALMSLGHGARSGNLNVNDGSSGGQPDLGMSVGMNGGPGVPATAAMQWPLLLFHDGTNVGGA